MNGSERITMNLKNGENTFSIELTDIYGYRYTESKTLKIGTNTVSTVTGPQITTINPKDNDSRITLYAGNSFNLRFSTSVGTEAREISIFLDDVLIQSATA